MKLKSLVLAIMVAASSTVLAQGAAGQTGVTLFGTVDVGLARVTGERISRTGVSHSGSNVSRYGIRGIEDLGGGLSAGFWLEAGFRPDTGEQAGANASFNRRATVSVMGPWGELRLGRDDSATFLSSLLFDPFMTNGVGGTEAFVMNGAPIIQISNAVSYFLPPGLGGVYGQLQFAPGEKAQDPLPATGEYAGFRLGYRHGAFNGALSAGRLDGIDQAPDVRLRNLALSYDLGIAMPMLLWASDKRGSVEVRALQLGVRVPFGPGAIRASVGRYDKSGAPGDWRKYAIGYAWDLSKRTQLYATYAHLDNASGASRAIGVQGMPAALNADGAASNGYQIGLRHFF